MKFRLIINPDGKEEVSATVHESSAMTEQIETLVLQHAGQNCIVAYTEDDTNGDLLMKSSVLPRWMAKHTPATRTYAAGDSGCFGVGTNSFYNLSSRKGTFLQRNC